MNYEKIAVDAIRQVFNRNDYFEQRILDDDRTPSWDGSIEVYNKPADQHEISDLLAIIPIQIKGHKSFDLDKPEIKFSVRVADLNNYLQRGGTVFFAVYFSDHGDKSAVYYNGLLPFSIKELLIGHEHQDTISIPLRLLPKDRFEVMCIFKNYAEDMKKQMAAIHSEHLTTEKLEKAGELNNIKISFTSGKGDGINPFDYAFGHDLYLYTELPYGILMPIEHITNLEKAAVLLPNDISIAGKKYYSEYAIVRSKNCMELCIGKSTVWRNDYDKQTSHFSFKLKGSLNQRIADLSFVIAALENGGFYANGVLLPFDGASPEEKATFALDSKRETLAVLTEARKTLDVLHIKADLNCDAITEIDAKNMQLLVAGILHGDAVPLNARDYTHGIMHLANLNILLRCDKTSKKGLSIIKDFFAEPSKWFSIRADKTHFDTSIFTTVKKDDFLTISNLDLDAMLNNLKAISYCEDYAHQVVLLLLEAISAYDASPSRTEFLKFADSLLCWQEQHEKDSSAALILLNHLQIKKRKIGIDENDIEKLCTLVESSKDEDILAGAYLLMDNQIAAKIHFQRMSNDRQIEFRNYPIFIFAQRAFE